MSSEYENPDAMLHDVITGKIACNNILLSEWVELNLMSMIAGKQPHLNLDLPYGGGLYSFHHCITSIKPPMELAPIKENVH